MSFNKLQFATLRGRDVISEIMVHPAHFGLSIDLETGDKVGGVVTISKQLYTETRCNVGLG